MMGIMKNFFKCIKADPLIAKDEIYLVRVHGGTIMKLRVDERAPEGDYVKIVRYEPGYLFGRQPSADAWEQWITKEEFVNNYTIISRLS
jgi:hypothetical protein